jgi:hypothetical protein
MIRRLLCLLFLAGVAASAGEPKEAAGVLYFGCSPHLLHLDLTAVDGKSVPLIFVGHHGFKLPAHEELPFVQCAKPSECKLEATIVFDKSPTAENHARGSYALPQADGSVLRGRFRMAEWRPSGPCM